MRGSNTLHEWRGAKPRDVRREARTHEAVPGLQHVAIAAMVLCLVYSDAAHAQEIQERGRTSYMPVDQPEPFAAMSPDAIRDKGLFPGGLMPLPHPNHPEGGMLFPKFHIDEIKRQEGRDPTRFDLDFDLPDHLLPEFPSAILTTRPDLGHVSQGELVTS
jgi:cytochrome c peroxidase